MLQNLLTQIRAGGSLETQVLAARLGTSPRMVEAMLDHLQRLGLIRDYIACSDGCAGCRVSEGCGNKNAPRAWQSTSTE